MLDLFGKTMKRLLLLTVFFLTACGPSQEEKQQIATIACNVMAESTTMDGAVKIKEVNQAREQIGEPPFLASSDKIQESLDYSICESLVLNDASYSDLLDIEKHQAEKIFKDFIEGFWLHAPSSEENRSILVANFKADQLIITEYIDNFNFDGKSGYKTTQDVFELKQINDSKFEVFNTTNNKVMFLSFDSESKSIFIPNSDQCKTSQRCEFKQAPNISAAQLKGSYVLLDGLPGFSTVSRYEESSWVSESINISDDDKTYYNSIDSADYGLSNGFIFRETWDDGFEGLAFLVSVQGDIFTYNGFFGAWKEKKVSDDYVLPDPPEGYKDISE